MTLLQDLLWTSRTINLLERARARDAYWRRFLTDLCGERERRDQAIREFCRRNECSRVHAEAVAQ